MEKEITWQATDHNHTQKSYDWFWVLGISAVSVSIIAILFRNFFFALLILVAAFTLALLARRTPRTMQFSISAQGLLAGTELYPWSTVLTFWVSEAGGSPALLVDTTKILAPHLFIPIPRHRAQKIRALLSKYAKESELHEPVSHKIIEFFGL